MHIEKISDTYHKITFSNGSEVFLVGTAHVSKNSVEEVACIIENENPDRVCIELDASRMASKTSNSWENTDIRKVFKEGKGFLLLANTALASFQRKLGAQTGANPGDEILGAAKLAEEKGIPVSLCDREIQTTFRRAWAKSSLWNKCKLLATLISAAFSDEEISPEELEDLKNQETLEGMLKEVAKELPSVKEVLIDERDTFLATKMNPCLFRETRIGSSLEINRRARGHPEEERYRQGCRIHHSAPYSTSSRNRNRGKRLGSGTEDFPVLGGCQCIRHIPDDTHCCRTSIEHNRLLSHGTVLRPQSSTGRRNAGRNPRSNFQKTEGKGFRASE